MEYKLKIDGMSCEGCVKNISKMMMEFESLKDVNINLEHHLGTITTTTKFDAELFINRFNGTKFTVQISSNNSKSKTSFISKLKNLI